MGGDNAPVEIVQGALDAINQFPDLEILLVGSTALWESSLFADLLQNANQGESIIPQRWEIVTANQVIEMHEEPALALRKKKESSIAVATNLVKTNRAEALVSAGSTGAQMAAGLLLLGRLPGVERPAIATILPGLAGPKVLLDCGANVDCKPSHLKQFAQMGSIYAAAVLGKENPQVCLLNIGEEASKGNELVRQTYTLLQSSPLNFAGNMEGRELLDGTADVILCDGFVGNIVLKLTEGVAQTVFTLIQEESQKRQVSAEEAAGIQPVLGTLQKRLDYAEYGGAPLLGVQGISIICHGSSKAKAIRNAIRVAMDSVRNDLVSKLAQSLAGDQV